MGYRQYDRLEQKILASGRNSIHLRWKWGRLVLCDDEFTDPSGRLRWGAINELVAKAAGHGLKLSRSEIKYRVQCAREYPTEAQIGQILGQFENWSSLIQAGFPAAEAAESDVPEPSEKPYDPRPPHEQRDAAVRQFKRILAAPEAHGQQPLPGMRIYLPGFTVDTTGRETTFRKALEIHESIKAVTPQLRQAADRAEREDAEREEKLYRLFDAVGRNLDATLGDGEDALLGAVAAVR